MSGREHLLKTIQKVLTVAVRAIVHMVTVRMVIVLMVVETVHSVLASIAAANV